MMELTDWSDIGKLDQFIGAAANEESEAAEDSKNLDNSKEKNFKEKNSNEDSKFDNSKVQIKEGNEKCGEEDDVAIIDWNDLRKFDDDHDDDWFKVQEKKLARQYGGNFVRVKYADHGRVVYFCELCVAECNAKKSLELHCNGMKHLKKKDLWEKEGKPPPQIGLKSKKEGETNPYKFARNQDSERKGNRNERQGKNSRNRDRDGRSWNEFGGRSRSRSPPRRGGDPWDRDRGRNRDRSRDRMDMDRPYRDGPMMHNDPWGPPPPMDPFQGGFSGNRGSPVHPSFSPPPRPQNFYDRDPYSSRGERRYPSPPSRLHNFGPDRYDDTPRAPSPPRFGSPERDSGGGKCSLTANPAGTLLQKLSECCVKSPEDAELAVNVVASLCKSLKEYSQKIGEIKIAELLMDAELKVGTVKALKVGMKILNSFGDSSNSNTNELDFLNTITRTQQERSQSMSSILPVVNLPRQNERPVTYPTNPYMGKLSRSNDGFNQGFGPMGPLNPGGHMNRP